MLETFEPYLINLVDDGLTYPNLSLSVHVAGPPTDTWGFSRWLGRCGCIREDDPERADIVFFAGGPDVNPERYHRDALPCTSFDTERDQLDFELYRLCIDQGIPMVGICRGAQLLWTTQGGTLYQDVDNHNEGEHWITHYGDMKKYLASSVHHQMCYPSSIEGFRLLAAAYVSTKRETSDLVSSGPVSDFEIFLFEKRAILGIQGHPEYIGWPQYSKLCADLIKRHIFDSEYTTYQNGLLRLKEKC